MRQMKKKLQQNKQSLSILLLLTMVAVILCVFLLRYYSVERESCVRHLREYTQDTSVQIRRGVERSQNYMNKISNIIYDSFLLSESTGQQRLSTLGAVDMLSRLELLMPDGTLYTPDGVTTDPTLSFDYLSKMGSGILPRSVDQHSSNRYVVRIFTPVRRSGKTAAILCGVVDVDRLAYIFTTTAYDGKAQLFLLEGRSGSCLIDPWHDVPGKLQDFDRYSFSRGYSHERLYEEFFNAREGSTALRGPNAPGKYYMYYAPVGCQDWMVMLAVPQNVAFAQANSVLFLFGFMVLLLVVLSVIFFAWFLWDVRQNQLRTDLRLRGARYMQDVQQTLFRAHVHPERFGVALDKVTEYLAADATAFFSLEHDQLILRNLSGAADKAPPKNSDLFKAFPQTAKAVMASGSFSSNRPYAWGERDWQSARSIGIRNIMLVRLNAMDGKGVIGILGAINTDVLWDDTTPLDQVALSFSMAIENSRNYQTLAYMSQVDELTGVMNRNSYETRVAELTGITGAPIGCIYIDANGLHEINNHLGHDAGDEMLRAVADTLLSIFEKKDVFRLGGDEFAVLVRAMSRQELELRAEKISQAVEKVGYSVSLGLEWQENNPQVAQVVSAAEATMRQNKADYYANHGGERQMRNLNTRMEQTLAAKRDADSLLSCLAPNFLGIYFVDPKKDTCRTMVGADFFKDMLAQSKDSFQGAMDIYIQSRVAPEDQQRMLDFCHYDHLVAALAQQVDMHLDYHRADGRSVHLQVRQPRRAEDNEHEIMWIFSMGRDTAT